MTASKAEPARRGAPPAPSAPASTLTVDFTRFLRKRLAVSVKTPIDEYYERAAEMLRDANDARTSDRVRSLLIVELVAAVEVYVRSIVVRLVSICPSAARAASKRMIALGSADYYPSAERALAIFDHQALCGAEEIRSAIGKVLGINVQPDSSTSVALGLFDGVCHLRHAVSHQAGRIALHNAAVLGDPPIIAGETFAVAIDPLRFQELLAICHSAVRALNQVLFEQTVTRWRAAGLLRTSDAASKARFFRLWNAFHSRTDLPKASARSAFASLQSDG